MGLNSFILNCEKENEELKKDIEYYKNKSKRLEQQLKQRDDVIDEIKDVINKMLTVGYFDKNKSTSYFGVSEGSEFGCRAKVILSILNKRGGTDEKI